MAMIELFVVVMEEEDMFVALVKDIVEMLSIVSIVEMVVVDIVVDVVGIIDENGKGGSFHKYILSNPFDRVGFGLIEETMPAKE